MSTYRAQLHNTSNTLMLQISVKQGHFNNQLIFFQITAASIYRYICWRQVCVLGGPTVFDSSCRLQRWSGASADSAEDGGCRPIWPAIRWQVWTCTEARAETTQWLHISNRYRRIWRDDGNWSKSFSSF